MTFAKACHIRKGHSDCKPISRMENTCSKACNSQLYCSPKYLTVCGMCGQAWSLLSYLIKKVDSFPDFLVTNLKWRSNVPFSHSFSTTVSMSTCNIQIFQLVLLLFLWYVASTNYMDFQDQVFPPNKGWQIHAQKHNLYHDWLGPW